MMNKKDILNILGKYGFNKDEFIILSGAALVLFDVKENTSDIDIAPSKELYEKLINEYNCIFEGKKFGNDVWFINNEINFGRNYYDVEYINYCGYKVQSLKSIYDLKIKLNREKDIEKILKYVKENNIKF